MFPTLQCITTVSVTFAPGIGAEEVLRAATGLNPTIRFVREGVREWARSTGNGALHQAWVCGMLAHAAPAADLSVVVPCACAPLMTAAPVVTVALARLAVACLPVASPAWCRHFLGRLTAGEVVVQFHHHEWFLCADALLGALAARAQHTLVVDLSYMSDSAVLGLHEPLTALAAALEAVTPPPQVVRCGVSLGSLYAAAYPRTPALAHLVRTIRRKIPAVVVVIRVQDAWTVSESGRDTLAALGLADAPATWLQDAVHTSDWAQSVALVHGGEWEVEAPADWVPPEFLAPV